MTLYVFDTDILSLYQRNHPQVCTRVRIARQNNLIIKTTVVLLLLAIRKILDKCQD